MKKNLKKIFSAFTVLAISATAVVSVAALAACGEKSQYKPSGTVDPVINGNTITVDTAIGTTQSTTSGNKYYVSADALGSQVGEVNNIDKPYEFFYLATSNILQPGDVVYFLPGTYTSNSTVTITVNGTFDKYITFMNAAYDKEGSGYTGDDTLVTLNFSNQVFDSTSRGVQIYGNYIYWYGIDVCGAGDNGLYIGGDFNTVEYSEFYNNRDTGLQLGRAESSLNSITQWPSYNLIKNCTSHNNYDNETYGENADGFAAKLTVGYGNVFDGCIAYRNSDDGWDLYAKSDTGNIGCVIMYNCVAFENGYLEYTRDECNSLYPDYVNFDGADKETTANPYGTANGDGNGFKLGGSIMEGDVIMYNCLSFHNRMHGVTDNSNPGYLKVEGVTSYDNSAAIDENGNVVSVNNSDTHGNIDVARQTYSYNTVKNVLSVHSSIPKSLDTDAYRGSVTDSILNAGSKANVIAGSLEADTRNAGGDTYTTQTNALDVTSLFKALPVVDNGDGTYTYNIKGNGDSMTIEGGKVTALSDTRVHLKYRNADGSINMGDILAKSEAGEATIESLLGEGVTAGSTLNLGSWGAYTHFYQKDMVDGEATSEAAAIVSRTLEALTLNCDEDAVYQDFQVPTQMLNATISWSSTDTQYIEIGKDEDVSLSGSKYIDIIVYRPQEADAEVQLTATVSYGGVTQSKTFTLTLKAGKPEIGDIYVIDDEGERVEDGGRYIVDLYKVYNEPEVFVKNGIYLDSEKLLDESLYDVKTTYIYQTDATANAVQVKGFTSSNAGVYTITKTVTLKSDAKQVGEMTYQIYVTSAAANVQFVEPATVTVYQDGYRITGEPSSATGALYSVTSPTQLTDVTKDSIKTYAGVEFYTFRDTSINFSFENANSGEYYIYYALTNANGDVTSDVYEVKISAVAIDSTDKFMTIAGGGTIGGEVPSQTIYSLTQDLDFNGVTYTTGTGTFSGLFNGLGHKISNLTTGQYIFYEVANGTIMNVKFNNIKITLVGSGDKYPHGIVRQSTGGYFYNIAITNMDLEGTQRSGGLIGYLAGSNSSPKPVYPLYISQVSLINSEGYSLRSANNRIGGLIGYVQYYGETINIDNCQVISDITAGGGEGGGIVASYEDTAEDVLNISKCYYSGTLSTDVAPGSSRLGGMLGYHKGGVGQVNISQCISLAVTYIQGEEVVEAVKNASPILGQYSSAGNTVVSKCIGLREEHNTDFDVDVFAETNLKRHNLYIEDDGYLGLDTETRWTIVYADSEDSRDLYKAPYVLLNFLGEWDA